MTGWQIDPQPTFAPDPKNYPEEEWGVEDARIVYLTELEQYAVTYTAYSARGPLVSLALTRDFKTFERRGMLMEPEDKDAALFPRRIGGKWVLIHRPVMPGSRAESHLSRLTCGAGSARIERSLHLRDGSTSRNYLI